MKKTKRVLKKVSNWLCKYINGTRGAITLFLALLMVPFMFIAGALINLGRINSAVAIFDEALCNASNSTLGTYDAFLRSRFGLLAMSQDFPDKGAAYTVDDFISETFAFYMEQNGLSLPSTFKNVETSAAGIYPLADIDVLRSQTLEASKYSVPLKLAIEGFNLDDILGSLTKKIPLVSSICGMVSSATDVCTSYDSFNEKMKTLQESLDNSNTAYTDYENAFTAFQQAVNDYNSLLTQRTDALAKCQSAITGAKNTLKTRQSEYDAVDALYGEIARKIEWLENEKDSNGNKVDNSAEIAELESTYADQLALYREAETKLEKAKQWLRLKEQEKVDTEEAYQQSIDSQRGVIGTQKTAYLEKINALIAQLQTLNQSLSSAQGDAAGLIEKSASTITGVINTSAGIMTAVDDNTIKELETMQKKALEAGNTKAANEYGQKIRELKNSNSEVNHVKDALTKGKDEAEAVASLEVFAEYDYGPAFREIYNNLDAKRTSTESVVIATGLNSMGKVDHCFYAFNFPITNENIEAVLEDLLNDVMDAAFVTVLKAIVSFICAIYEMLTEIGYDHKLDSVINPGNYSNIGGMPSKRSQDSFASDYLESDGQKSEENKEVLGAYSNNGSDVGNLSVVDSAIDSIMGYIGLLQEAFNMEVTIWTLVDFLKKLFEGLVGIVGQIMLLAGEMLRAFGQTTADMVTSAVKYGYSKMLLIGYLGYNTSNRTTYQSSALTGASYSSYLPSTRDKDADGYAFYGAETEYIIFGFNTERENQRCAYYSILVTRLIYDAFIVYGSPDVQMVAAAAGAATAFIGGIGYGAVIVLWTVAEAMIDAMILCNGGSINYVKTTVYLSVPGIPSLVQQILGLSLTNSTKDRISGSAAKALDGIANHGNDPQKREELNKVFYEAYDKEASRTENINKDLADLFTYDYTKMLMIYMLFKSDDTLLRRLADIIQMEGTWSQRNKSFTTRYDLGKSYTYLRAAGTFSANQFIQISEGDLTARESIVYRGY